MTIFFVTYLKTWQMWVSQLHAIFVQEVLCHSALHCLPIFQLQWETLHLCWFSCDITDTILSPHGPTMSDLNFQAFDFFGELDSL